MEMIMRLYAYYVSLPIENKIIKVVEPEQVIIKKTRNKKNG
jgi:hypothetical protein